MLATVDCGRGGIAEQHPRYALTGVSCRCSTLHGVPSKFALGAFVRRMAGHARRPLPFGPVDVDQDQSSEPSTSTLDSLIPPEITGDDFSEAIVEVASTLGVQEILEIGSSAGAGSTAAWVRGALANPELPRPHCIEVSTVRFAALSARWREHQFVNCYNVSSVPIECFPSAAEVETFYREVRSDLNRYPLESVLQWLRQDVDYLREHRLSGRGIREIKALHGIDTFDAVLIDGSEFTGSAELDEVYGARFLLLDDTRAFKNWKNVRRLGEDVRYRLHRESGSTRNGFAVFERVS